MKRLDADYAAALAKFLASQEHDEEALEQAYELGLPAGCGQAEVGLALDEAEAQRRDYESAERAARAESQRLQSRKAELEEKRRALMKRDELWPRLDEVARRLGVVDRIQLEQAWPTAH